MNWRAYVESDLVMNEVRLLIIKDRADGRRGVLAQDGSWIWVVNGERLPGTAGIALEPEALPVLAEAIAKHLGNTLPSQAEVAILRDALDVERGRVDNVLFRATEIIGTSP